MCYFITIGIPESKAGDLEEQARPGMSAWRCENSHIMAHLDAGFQGYVLTIGMCSCDLYRSPTDDETMEDTIRRLQEKYRKKGWTEAKVQRAIADATATWNPEVRGLRRDARELIARGEKRGRWCKDNLLHVLNHIKALLRIRQPIQE